jgi:NAD-dependent deacetylase
VKEINPQQLAALIRQSRRAVALTGAGISVESGIPSFRGAGGLWERYNPMEYAHIQALRTNPAKVWTLLKELDETITRARPNPAHYALAELEARGLLLGIITQNVDNLHQAAGSRKVVEYHGNALRFVCLACRRLFARQSLDFDQAPLYCPCGGLIKPDVVFFGEPIPPRPSRRPRNWPSPATCSWSSAPPRKWPRPATCPIPPGTGAPPSWKTTWNPPSSPAPSPTTSCRGLRGRFGQKW